MLSDTVGNQFTVGGTAGNALNATAAGLGIGDLSATSTAAQIQLGAITAGTTAIDGKSNGGNSTGITLQNTAYTNSTGTAQSPAQKWVFVFDDGTATEANIAGWLNNGTTTASASTKIVSAAGTTASTKSGSEVTFVANTSSTTGGISLAKNADGTNATNGSITDLGNGNAVFTFDDTQDAQGNPTEQTNVVLVNIAHAGNTTAANGTQASITNAINDLVGVMQNVGFGVSVDSSNNITIAGNNVNSTAGTPTVSAGTNGAFTSTTSVQVSGATAAIANINGAINSLGNISSTLGIASDQISGMQSFASSLSRLADRRRGRAHGCRHGDRKRSVAVAADQAAASASRRCRSPTSSRRRC